MSRKPSIAEIGAFLARVQANANTDPGPLLAEKAELLERIAANNPDDREAAEVAEVAEVARDARQAANEHRRSGR